MSKRLQVLIVEDEYLEIQASARRRRMTVSEWVRRALRKAMDDQPGTAEAKLRAIADASRHSFPTADIETMLGEMRPDGNAWDQEHPAVTPRSFSLKLPPLGCSQATLWLATAFGVALSWDTLNADKSNPPALNKKGEKCWEENLDLSHCACMQSQC